MDKLSIPKLFVDNGASARKFENFQQVVFRDLNLKNSTEPISFYRSDFRGATIINMHFWKNDFERADFINAYVSNTTFEECHFCTDFTNIIFERVKFKGNVQDTCAFYNCLFLKCEFANEKITQTVIRNCEYSQSFISDCIFDKNAFDDLVFIETDLQNITLADMGALNFTFDGCTFKNVALDPDYFGSYLVKNTSMEGISYEYRSHPIPLSGNLTEDYRTLSIFYLDKKRYHEAFNSAILFHFHSGTYSSLIPFFEKIINAIDVDTHFIRRLEELERCVRIIEFYATSGILSAKDSFYMTGMFRKIDTSTFRLKDRLSFDHSLQELENLLQDSVSQVWIWNSIDPFSLIMAEVQIEECDLEIFKAEYQEYLAQLLTDADSPDRVIEFQITSVKKGSLIVQFISYAIAIFGLAKIIKSTISELYSIKLEYEIQKQAIKLITENTPNDPLLLQKNIQTARKIINEPSDELIKKSGKLSALFKRFNIYANALSYGGHSMKGIKK